MRLLVERDPPKSINLINKYGSFIPKEYDCVYVEILPKECLNVVYYNRSGDDNKFMRNYNDLGELSFFFGDLIFYFSEYFINTYHIIID